MRQRWSAWTAVLAAAVVAVAITGAVAGASHLKEQPKKHKVVYHLSDPDKTKFVLGNIENHIAGVGGPDNIEAIELVVHGPALRSFLAKSIDPEVKETLARLQKERVTFGACGNTMKAFNVTLEQLPAGAHPLPQGGVVRIMELQEQGYVYIRP
jgi:intracellular sulfur oxidation DsrE/DsrF family protein